MRRPPVLLGAGIGIVTLAAVLLPTSAGASSKPAGTARYLVVAKSAADYAGLRSQAAAAGARVHDLHGSRTFAVDSSAAVAAKLSTSALAATVVRDHIETLIQPETPSPTSAPTSLSRDRATHLSMPGGRRTAPQDPAHAVPGLLWNVDRIRAPQANAVTYGSPAVTVAVADTGLDYTHSELASKVSGVVDFTGSEDPPICKTFFGASDADMAALYGGPENTDWNGHGSWIGGNIAAALDGVGINGIAPKVNLVALKISQWCGSAYDSELIGAFEYAGNHGIDIVSISFGGYLDRSDPAQDAIYQQYVQTVATARQQGTLIVAAAGNEHARIGAGGKVLSHGTLTLPGDVVFDAFGQYETPGGIPGVIDVSSTGNVVAGASASCDPLTVGANATCKPASDLHQPTGVGRKDQLAYYSNYGPRIDVAGPGGARKFNLPNADRGGTPGFPYTTADGTTVYEDFSITSNWALEIPCFTFSAPTIFYPDECYSAIQGTSMATPHASAVAALIASAHPWLRHKPGAIAFVLKASARDDVRNTTPPLSATDTSGGDRTGGTCPDGYCHLGGRPISSDDAYGAGIVDALAAVRIG